MPQYAEFLETNSNAIISKTVDSFWVFFFHFWNVHEIQNILKKTISILAELFPKVLFREEIAIEKSRRSSYRTPFGNQRVNGFQTPLKVARHH